MTDINHNPSKKRRVGRTVLIFTGAAILLISISIVVSAIISPADSRSITSAVVVTAAVVETPAPEPTATATSKQSTSAFPQRIIIREGYISLVVENIEASKRAVIEIVNEMEAEGAFVVTSNERGAVDGQMPTIYITIRVPSNRFDEVMERLAAMSVRVSQRREVAQDVTEEYVDLQARLESMESARDRLREIMQEAETVEELLMAEQQLAAREAEIEAIQGRLKYLAQSAQLSKIEVFLYPSVSSQPIAARWQPDETARKALKGLVKSIQGAADIVIYFGIAVLPWLIVFGLIAYGVYRIAKRRRAKHNQNEGAGQSTS